MEGVGCVWVGVRGWVYVGICALVYVCVRVCHFLKSAKTFEVGSSESPPKKRIKKVRKSVLGNGCSKETLRAGISFSRTNVL